MSRVLILLLAALTVIGFDIAAESSAIADPIYAQYYPPGPVIDIRTVRRRLARLSRQDRFKAQHGVRPEAPLSGPFPVMPGGAPLSELASALFAMQYVGARLAVQAPVIETDICYEGPKSSSASLLSEQRIGEVIGEGDDDEERVRHGSVGMLACGVCTTVSPESCAAFSTCRRCARSTAAGAAVDAAYHVCGPDRTGTMGCPLGAMLRPAGRLG
jgi:hypothetical protein